MSERNKHGLNRVIPEGIKREIRQRCGFGCVICGLGFYDYEHFAPDFADALKHDPIGMTLLCSQCNQKRARGRLSAETVAIANDHPKCKEQGYSNEIFDFNHEPVTIHFAGLRFYDCQHIIVVNGEPLLSIVTSTEDGGPVLISGRFCDSLGRETLTITDNIWKVNADYWDVECVGPVINVRSGPREINLSLKLIPPRELIISRIEMQYQGVYFRGDAHRLEISLDGRNWSCHQGVDISHCFCGISINNNMGASNDSTY